MQRLLQPSFARGEIGPDLYGRTDVAAYKVALRTALNVIIHAYGGASNRPGLRFVGPCISATTKSRLIEFKYNTTDTYILEFGRKKMRVIRDDAHVLQSAKNITGITQANPAVVTANAHGYSNGDDVYIDGVVGMIQVNRRWFKVAGATENTFQLTDQQTSANINTTGYTAYGSGGTVSRVYEITTPYEATDLEQLTHVQSANVMTLTHRNYAPQELSRSAHDNWALAEITFAPSQTAPSNLTLSVGTAGTTTYRYKVTATNRETQEESLAATNASSVAGITATAANPVVCTKASHGFSEGDELYLTGFTQMTQLNGRRFTAVNVSTDNFTLLDEDGSTYAAETTGGTAHTTYVKTTLAAATANNTISVDSVTGAGSYSFYKEDNGVYGFIGTSDTPSFTDNNIAADTSLTPPKYRNPFYGATKHPGAVTYYEQRRVFGNLIAKPDTCYYSVTGSASNMTFSSPTQDDDAITATLNARQVNEIRGFVPGNDLLIFTAGAEWRVNSGNDAAFSAKTIRQKPQSYWGSSWRQPLVIGDKMLFVTENECYVRSIGYEITIDGYKGTDMTVFAPHLFRHHTLQDWAQSLSPDPQITTVRSDGIVCNLTFNPEQEVIAWARWKTDGKFRAVASTRPSSSYVDTMPYFVVERKIGGAKVQYIERLGSRRFADIHDAFFVDSGLSYDSPVTITGCTSAYPVVVTAASHGFANGDEVDIFDVVWEPEIDDYFNEVQPRQLNKQRYYVAGQTANTFALVKQTGRKDITAATQANPVVISSPGHGFADGAVVGIFNVLGMTNLNGKVYKVANVTDDTFELQTTGGANVDGSAFGAYTSGGQIYPAEDGSAFSAYIEGGTARKAVSTVYGLWHLEGREVVVLADGNVISKKVVQNGSLTFPRKYSRIHVGLRYISDIETLDPEKSNGTLQGKHVRVPQIVVRFKDSRGLLVGPNVNSLREMKQRENENIGEPTSMLTGDKRISVTSTWRGGGRQFFRQINPLPLTILSVMSDVDEGDDETQ